MSMARGLGSSGGATLQRSKLDLKQEVKTAEPRVDNSGGGGNNGKNIFNGGGGGDDGGDGVPSGLPWFCVLGKSDVC